MGHDVMAIDLPLFIVEMSTPGEIVEARRCWRPRSASTIEVTNATNFRVVDRDGTIVFDKLVADFN
jgi:hypothetical protein